MRRPLSLLILAVGCAQAQVNPAPDAANRSDGATLGAFGSDCTQAGDCQSGFCYLPPGTQPPGICTMPCTVACPRGFECKHVQLDDHSEADVCVPATDTICNRC